MEILGLINQHVNIKVLSTPFFKDLEELNIDTYNVENDTEKLIFSGDFTETDMANHISHIRNYLETRVSDEGRLRRIIKLLYEQVGNLQNHTVKTGDSTPEQPKVHCILALKRKKDEFSIITCGIINKSDFQKLQQYFIDLNAINNHAEIVSYRNKQLSDPSISLLGNESTNMKSCTLHAGLGISKMVVNARDKIDIRFIPADVGRGILSITSPC